MRGRRPTCPAPGFCFRHSTAKIGLRSMATPESKPSRDDTQEQLRSVQAECKRLREENARLKVMLGIGESVEAGIILSHANVSEADSSKSGGGLSTPEGKISLFRSLFRGRECGFRATAISVRGDSDHDSWLIPISIPARKRSLFLG